MSAKGLLQMMPKRQIFYVNLILEVGSLLLFNDNKVFKFLNIPQLLFCYFNFYYWDIFLGQFIFEVYLIFPATNEIK